MKGIQTATAAALLAATLAGSVWLYLYRVSSVARFVDQRGAVYHPSYTMAVQPWWSVFAALLLFAVGTPAALSVLPDRARLLQRLRRVVAESIAPSREAPRSGRLPD